jgi:hypothetical protein
MSKTFTLVLILILAASSLIMVIPPAQATKPAIPEFTLKLIPSSYSVTTTDPILGKKQLSNSITVQ